MPCQLWTRCCACEPMESLQHNSVFIPRRARSTRWIRWKGNVLTHSRLEPSLAQGLEIARFPGMGQEVTCWVLVQFVEIAALLSRSGLVRAVTLQPEVIWAKVPATSRLRMLWHTSFATMYFHSHKASWQDADLSRRGCCFTELSAAQRALCCLLVFGIQHHLQRRSWLSFSAPILICLQWFFWISPLHCKKADHVDSVWLLFERFSRQVGEKKRHERAKWRYDVTSGSK